MRKGNEEYDENRGPKRDWEKERIKVVRDMMRIALFNWDLHYGTPVSIEHG